jgi:hypothetical protein
LATLQQRQWLGFGEYRRALLSAVRSHEPLEHWRPNLRAGATPDLGVMILEFWAYILDVTGFYDARMAERSYLSTAPDAETLAKIVSLVGYRPRPAMAARVLLALEASGADAINVPSGTAFRSEPFDDEPPQVFELLDGTTVWPQRNRWRFAPIREDTFDGILTFPAGSAPNRNGVIVAWNTDDTATAAGRVVGVETISATGGEKLLRAHLDPAGETAVASLAGQPTADISIAQLRIGAGLSSFTAAPHSTDTDSTTILLDTLYPQVRSGDHVAVEITGALHPAKVSSATTRNIELTAETSTVPATFIPQTEIVLDTVIGLPDGAAPVIHISMSRLPAPLRPTKAFFDLSDLQPSAFLSGPVEHLDNAPASGLSIALGRKKRGAELPGTFQRLADGNGLFTPDSEVAPFTESLAAPARLFGNVVEAVRGETVFNEVLGSSDGASPNQAFDLKKKTLAWTEDPSAPDGRRPFLEISVDGIVWSRVDTLFDTAPDARIYIVRQNSDGTSRIVFGDGINGAIPPSGGDNIMAVWYRHGAGSAKPPAGFIQQLKRPVTGVSRVRSPLPASGGADADSADDLRDNAPGFALALGRAVSIDDFEALARGFAGVLNAAAGWAWDGRKQRAVATIWIIADQGDPGDELTSWLKGLSAPGLGITVKLAVVHALDTLSIDIAVHADHDSEQVRIAALSALFDPQYGVLSPVNIAIGQPIYRSAIVKALHLVSGVSSVRSVRLGGTPLDFASHPGEGGWFDLEDNATVGVVQ